MIEGEKILCLISINSSISVLPFFRSVADVIAETL